MISWRHLLAAGILSAAAMPAANAASVTCGSLVLGVREVTVDPALACTYAGMDNLGDTALRTLLNTLLGVTDSTIIDRDASNSNGGALNITGVGGNSGTWSFAASAWDYGRVFMYFHFGDGPDAPAPGSRTDPDIFIVELLRPSTSGTWSFGGTGARLNGLSNIALLGTGTASSGGSSSSGGTSSGTTVPEPSSSLVLVGLGLLGLGFVRRMKRAA